MKVRVSCCELKTARGDERFEAVRVVRAKLAGAVGGSVLAGAEVPCRAGELEPGAFCARCPHLLNVVPEPDGETATVRCMFLETDPVERVMTPAAHVAVVDALDTVEQAAARAAERGVPSLVVVQDGEAMGLVDAAELAKQPPASPVYRHARQPLPVVPRTMPLGQVAQVLRESSQPFLVVIDGDQLAGTISRGGLRELSVPDL